MHAYKAKPKPLDPMQRRIPKNPKYANVKSTIDTGASITKYMRKIEEIRENYRYRKDEIFKRMKATTFVQLMVQVAEINSHMHDADYASTIGDADTEIGDVDGDTERTLDGGQRAESAASLAVSESDFGQPAAPASARSTMQSVISGVGELDLGSSNGGASRAAAAAAAAAAVANWTSESPYLLLDVRDRDAYCASRIIGAVSYPHTMISRAQNYEIPQMLACRNRPGRIVVVYDEDEKIAPRVATTLVERGYDNLFLLSGGLKVAARLFPEGLVTGDLPLTCRSAATTGRQSRPATQLAASSASAAARMASDADQLDIDRLREALDAALDARSGSSCSGSSVGTARSSVASSRRPGSSAAAAAAAAAGGGGRPPFK